MLLEAVVSTAIVVTLLAAVFSLIDPAQGAVAVQPQAAEMQQRARAAFAELRRDLLMAGSGRGPGSRTALGWLRAPVVPGSLAAPAGRASDSAFTVFHAPSGATGARLDSELAAGSQEALVSLAAGPGCARPPRCGVDSPGNALVFDRSGRSELLRVTRARGPDIRVRRLRASVGAAYPPGASIVPVTVRGYTLDRRRSQLRRHGGTPTTLPFVDGVDDLIVRYFGGRLPVLTPASSVADASERVAAPCLIAAGAGSPPGDPAPAGPGIEPGRAQRRSVVRRQPAVRRRPVPCAARAHRDAPPRRRRCVARARVLRAGVSEPSASHPGPYPTRRYGSTLRRVAWRHGEGIDPVRADGRNRTDRDPHGHGRAADDHRCARSPGVLGGADRRQPSPGGRGSLCRRGRARVDRRRARGLRGLACRRAGRSPLGRCGRGRPTCCGRTVPVSCSTSSRKPCAATDPVGAAQGRGLAWSLFLHGRLARLVPLPAEYGEWYVAVWLAREEGADPAAPDTRGILTVHAAAFDPGRGQRALQADLVRVVPPFPTEGAPPGYAQLLAWRVVR